jgi:uncharacterized PurR-regulated membrane protein YhhQ (DUF165 family)
MWNELISFLFFLLPMGFILYCWRYGDAFTFAAALMALAVLSSAGAGKVIPLFGQEVAGGSTYIPATFILIALMAKKFSNTVALRVLNGVFLGLVLYTACLARWLAFAYWTPTGTTHDFDPSLIALRNAMLTTIPIYFSGIFIIAVRKLLMDVQPHFRTWTPVFLDIVLTTPISLLAVYWASGGDAAVITEELVYGTIAVRFVMPVLVISYILWETRGKRHGRELQ